MSPMKALEKRVANELPSAIVGYQIQLNHTPNPRNMDFSVWVAKDLSVGYVRFESEVTAKCPDCKQDYDVTAAIWKESGEIWSARFDDQCHDVGHSIFLNPNSARVAIIETLSKVSLHRCEK